MNEGRTVFSQLIEHLPLQDFHKCVRQFKGNHRVRSLSCLDQFLCMAFAQLTYRESLRDIEACLRAVPTRLYHMGFRGQIARNTLAVANQKRDWRIYANFAYLLIGTAQKLYMDEPWGLTLKRTVYALDYERLYRLHRSAAYFVTRPRKSFRFKRIYSHAVDLATGVCSDHTVKLVSFYSVQGYPEHLRRIRFVDPKTKKKLTFITNNFTWSSATIALLYKARWQVELFFKWIKQHLRIKSFFGTSENAVKSQIWISISVYVLVAILKKRLQLPQSQYEILQVLSLSLFEKTPVGELFTKTEVSETKGGSPNQLLLFDL